MPSSSSTPDSTYVGFQCHRVVKFCSTTCLPNSNAAKLCSLFISSGGLHATVSFTTEPKAPLTATESKVAKPDTIVADAGDTSTGASPWPSHDATLITHTDDRVLRATYTSRIFRFVDDVELRVDTTKGLVHIRSASRVGHDDLEANPKRVERIRADWIAAR